MILRLSFNCLLWGAGRIPEPTKLRLGEGEEEWKGKHLGTLLGFKHTKAPNQITGYLCRRFFAEDNRQSVLEAVAKMSGWMSTYRREMKSEEKEALRNLLQRFSVIGRVIASDRHIKVVIFTIYLWFAMCNTHYTICENRFLLSTNTAWKPTFSF
jgi:hypothetical protein